MKKAFFDIIRLVNPLVQCGGLPTIRACHWFEPGSHNRGPIKRERCLRGEMFPAVAAFSRAFFLASFFLSCDSYKTNLAARSLRAERLRTLRIKFSV